MTVAAAKTISALPAVADLAVETDALFGCYAGAAAHIVLAVAPLNWGNAAKRVCLPKPCVACSIHAGGAFFLVRGLGGRSAIGSSPFVPFFVTE